MARISDPVKFVAFINTLINLRGTTVEGTIKKTPDVVKELCKLIIYGKLFDTYDYGSDNMNSIEHLQEAFEKYALPFHVSIINYDDTTDCGRYGFTINFTQRPRMVDRYLSLYLEGMSKLPIIPEDQFVTAREAITLLYNDYRYPFYPDHPNMVYDVDDINTVFAHDCIEYRIKTKMITVNSKKHPEIGYYILRCRW